jgi:hypothetical protein
MDDHPNEVITLVFESYVHESDAMFDYFAAAGLFSSLFFADRPNPEVSGPDGTSWNVPVHGWPRLRQMVNAGKRLVIFSDNGVLWKRYSGQPIGGPSTTEDDGLPNYWSSVVENVYGDDSVLGDVEQKRGESEELDDPLFPLASMNWFPTANVVGPDYGGDNFPSAYTWDYGNVNSYDNMDDGLRNFANVARRYPNFVNVDFYHKGGSGGPRKLVKNLNAFWGNRPGIAASLIVTPPANSFGWRQSASVTAKGVAGGTGNAVRWINHYWHGGHDILGHAEATGSTRLFGSTTVSISPTNGSGGIDGIFRISAEALNQSFDRSDRAVSIVRVDSTAPLVAPAITRPPDGNDGWYNNSVTIGVRVLDLLSGARRAGSSNLGGQAVISEDYVSSETNQYIERTFNFFYEQEGQVFVRFYAEDFAGNVNAPDSGFILVKLDRTPPTTTVNLSNDGPSSTMIGLSAHDTLSGVHGTWFQLDGQTDWSLYTGPVRVSRTQPHTLRFYSRDLADNAEPIKTFYIEQVAVGLSSSRNPAGFFQKLSLTATVAGRASTPTGTVTFFDGAHAMSTVALDANGRAELELTPLIYTLPRGTRELTARYNGDSQNSPATSRVLLQEVVDPPAVQLTSSAARVVQTQPVVLSATVAERDGIIPTGTVKFRVLNSASGRETFGLTVPLDTQGSASITMDQLPFGIYWLFADYNGDALFPPGSSGSARELYVDLAETFVSITTTPNPSRFGEPVTFTIAVSNTPGATAFQSGSVRIEESDTALETLLLDQSGHATYTTSALAEGDHFFIVTANTVPRLSGGVTSLNHTVLPVITTNTPPTLASLEDKQVSVGQLLTVSSDADDPDLPPQNLTFTLGAGAPAGAIIDPATGLFQWSPGEGQADASYTITVVVQDNGEPPLSATESFLVTVTDPSPKITRQPQDVLQDVRASAVFEVEALGADLSYQWQFNGGDLPNETNATLVVANVRVESNGEYAVLVANPHGSVLSSKARLAVRLVPVDLGVVENHSASASVLKLLALSAKHASHPLTLQNVSATSAQNGSITWNGNLITYSAPPGYAGSDAFSYTVSNGHGSTAQGELRVKVASANAQSLNLISIALTETQRVVQFAGVPGRVYVLQFAPGATGPWADLSDPRPADSTGLIQFTDPTTPVPPVRFYRVRAVSNNP